MSGTAVWFSSLAPWTITMQFVRDFLFYFYLSFGVKGKCTYGTGRPLRDRPVGERTGRDFPSRPLRYFLCSFPYYFHFSPSHPVSILPTRLTVPWAGKFIWIFEHDWRCEGACVRFQQVWLSTSESKMKKAYARTLFFSFQGCPLCVSLDHKSLWKICPKLNGNWNNTV